MNSKSFSNRTQALNNTKGTVLSNRSIQNTTHSRQNQQNISPIKCPVTISIKEPMTKEKSNNKTPILKPSNQDVYTLLTQNQNTASKNNKKNQLSHQKHSNRQPLQNHFVLTNQILIHSTNNFNDSSNINCSKWLDNQKEMKEFIIGLKSRKSSGKLSGISKVSEGFEIDQRTDEKEELLCHKLLVVKRVERHQKEAINYFYSKDYQQSFQQLSKAESLLKKEKIKSAPHSLYINYLYSQFYFKLSNPNWKQYLIKAKSYIPQIQPEEFQSMQNHIWGVKALDVCLALQNQQYDKILIFAEQFRSLQGKNRRIRKRVRLAQITAFQKKGNPEEALKVIEDQLLELEDDTEITATKREQDRCRLLKLKMQIWAEFGSRNDAINQIESLITFRQASSGQQSPLFYNHAIFEIYSSLLRRDEADTMKLLYLYQQWIQIEPVKKQKVRLQLKLFKLYFQIGIYQRALELFQQISSQNVVYLDPEYLHNLSQIKHFQGEEQEAISILSKIIDMTNGSSKLLYSFKILELNLSSEERLERQLYLEKMLKAFPKSENYQEVLGLYREYIRRKGKSKSMSSRTGRGQSLCEI